LKVFTFRGSVKVPSMSNRSTRFIVLADIS
jgi:hypothetical protein